MKHVIFAIVAVAGCGNKKKDSGEKPETKVERPPAAIDAAMAVAVDAAVAASDPCSPQALKLAPGVTVLPPLQPSPSGCTPKEEKPRLIRSVAELDQHVTCTGAKPAVDFAKQAIVVSPISLSPRALGVTTYDDGKTITVVYKYDAPQPGEPNVAGGATREVYWYVVPAGSDRAFATAGCEM